MNITYDETTQETINGYQKLISERIEYLAEHYRGMVKAGAIQQTAHDINKMERDTINDPLLVHLRKGLESTISTASNIVTVLAKEEFDKLNFN